jgi:predicted nucleic acid-binding protein
VIILDTNVVSEQFRSRPDVKVRDWIDAQPANALFICAPVLAELRYGLERLAPGARKEGLRANIERIENDLYRGRALPFDAAAAAEYGRVVAERERIGRRIEQMDALIAAIALTHGAALATRDAGGFAELGIDLINPFETAVGR